jgi:hypothetical protein
MDAPLPADLLELKARFEAWRQTRQFHRSRTPDQLRQAAVALLQRYPASLICRVCRLNPETLKRAASSPTAPSKRQPPESFFRLPLGPVSETGSSLLQTTAGCRLQLERPDGSRLILTLPRMEASSIHALCSDFLRP